MIDEEAQQTKSSETDDVAVHDKLDTAFARQNNSSDAADDDSTVAAATKCKESMLAGDIEADASFGDDDDNDGSHPAAVAQLNATENAHEVKKNNLVRISIKSYNGDVD